MRKALRNILIFILATPLILCVAYKFIPASSTLMLYRSLTGTPVWRTYVPLEQISPKLIKAVIVSEDAKFCQHNGVDWPALEKQINHALAGENVRGASTLSMQLAKNLYLWNSRSYLRKGLEVPLALMTDFVLGKRRVLEQYLNVAEWGPGVYGVEAAAQTYFGVHANQLTGYQASVLATSLPNPLGRNSANPHSRQKRLATINRNRVHKAGDVLSCLQP
ncbi:monofunctional biosynthetic peptidoglycan transglycosylase [Polycladidibacter stylochi]|uniref:monofunctional biosynthetic peptidoglycan transglycosylase n=1 Tax=Polycladidibacter stylochi TaxID=1807766 RepID=UPI000836EFAF|nr:monofunctional biosynthetic peptidoglycan transglycosylase [Pseudovibrio stylochi]